MQIDPEDFSPLHDAAQGFLDANRPADAVNLFQELLQREPDYPGADACLHYARFKATGNPQDRAALLTLRDRRWWDRAARSYANEIDPPVPYFTVLPGPADATSNYARDVVDDFGELLQCCGHGASIAIAIQSHYPESPSAALAFDFAMRSIGAGSAQLSDRGRAVPATRPAHGQGARPVPDLPAARKHARPDRDAGRSEPREHDRQHRVPVVPQGRVGSRRARSSRSSSDRTPRRRS